MPFVLRYSDNDTGAITFTGNTLGLSRSQAAGVPGTMDAIGAFVTTDMSMQYEGYPAGTTADYHANSASAVLQLPEGSEVKYAELIWGGTYRVTGGTNNEEPFLDKEVFLTTPQGTRISIVPDPATAQVSYRNEAYNYVRSADVTAWVRQGGAGVYTVGGVVGIMDVGASTANNCGWTLCVVYEDPQQPLRNLSLRVGIVEIATGSDAFVNTEITGFATPVEGPIRGRMAIVAQDGDPNKTGDRVLFGPDEDSLQTLSGPNNLADNFFASQINNDDGLLDMSGTFGSRNAINGITGSQIIGGRQGWDITNIDISSALVNSQTEALLQLRTAGDGYSILAVGLYIDINSPRITILKTIDAEAATIGQTLTYTVDIWNSGTASASALFLLDALPKETEFVPGSVTVDGERVPLADPLTGVDLGTLAPEESIVITYQALVTAAPPSGVYVNLAVATFEYESVPGVTVFPGDIPSNEVETLYVPPTYQLTISKTPDREEAAPSDIIHYTVVVTNDSLEPVTDVVIEDRQLGLDTVIPVLDVSESRTFTAFYVVPAGTPAGTSLVSTTAVNANETNTVVAEAAVQVRAVPGMRIVQSANRRTASPGDTVIFQLTVINTGNVTLHDIQVTDPLINAVRTIERLEQDQSVTFHIPFLIPVSTSSLIQRSFEAGNEERLVNVAYASVRPDPSSPVLVAESNRVEIEIVEDEE